MHRLRFTTLGLFLLGTACGGQLVPEPFDPGPPVQPRDASDGGTASTQSGTLLMAAAQDDAIVVFAVDPATGDVHPFGPALPARVSSYAAATVTASADNRRAVVSLAPSATVGVAVPADRPSLVLAGDGVTWRTIASETVDSVLSYVSTDLSTIWVKSACAPLDYIGPSRDELFDFAGTSRWKDASCATTILDDVALAPDGSFAVAAAASSLNVLEVASGASARVATATGYAKVITTFATSSLVVTGDRTVAWLDAKGEQLDVPGASTDAADVVGAHGLGAHPYQVVNGQLSVLRDRAVEPIQKVPTWVRPDDVHDHLVGHYAVVSTPDGALASIGLDGSELARRVAPARPNLAGVVGHLAHSFDGRWPWVVTATSYVTPGTDVGDLVSVEELWLPGDPANGIPSQSQPLRTYTNQPHRSYFASPSGEQVLYTDEARTLHRIDVATMTDTTIGGALLWF